jgi:hypothetical protein
MAGERRRLFVTGHCTRGNPARIHGLCRRVVADHVCSCSCHRVADLGAVLVEHDVAGLVADLERVLSGPGEWPPAARRLVVAARELLSEVG